MSDVPINMSAFDEKYNPVSSMCGSSHSSFEADEIFAYKIAAGAILLLSIPFYFIFRREDKETKQPKNSVARSIMYSLLTATLVVIAYITADASGLGFGLV